MYSVASHGLKTWRLVTGAIAGAAVAILGVSILMLPLLPFVLIIGSVIAIVLVPIVLIPAYHILMAKHWLTIWWAIFLGALLTSFPNLLLSLPDAIATIFDIGDRSRGSSSSFNNVVLLDRGRLTAAGWYVFFKDLGMMSMMGAIGGLVGWVVAAGFRFRIR